MLKGCLRCRAVYKFNPFEERASGLQNLGAGGGGGRLSFQRASPPANHSGLLAAVLPCSVPTLSMYNQTRYVPRVAHRVEGTSYLPAKGRTEMVPFPSLVDSTALALLFVPA